ncbi:MAG: hypothetical protein WAX04_11825 [Oscillospiraceae bacterium]
MHYGFFYPKTAGASISRAIGVELIKDSICAGSGYVAGQIGTYYATEWFGADAGKWIGLGSGLVAGFGTSGGLNRIDKLYNVNGAHSFMDAMSAKDAERYSEYWNNVEAGKYDIPYRMNATQYTQYVKGLNNVQDATVLKSFDFNELFELRNKGEIKTTDDVYAGAREASNYLKSQGVPRQYRKQIMESFNVGTIKLETATDSTFGIRFYGGNANAEGRYLFETFSPVTNRQNLALPYEWNSMSEIQQFQVKSGTTMITGNAAAQTSFGSQYIGGAKQWYVNSLEDIIK